MTEGQKVHRLIGCMYGTSKRTFFYDDLLEDFNEGLWFGKIEEKELIGLCAVLVKDELAEFVAGTHAAAAYPSDRETSKGITIHNTAFTAYINKEYDKGGAASPKVLIIAVIVIVVIMAVGYNSWQRGQMKNEMDQADRKLEELLQEMGRLRAQKDSVISVRDSLIKKQGARIKVLETPPPVPPAKKTARRR